ncbi:acidic repeat-containing protein-like [Setaria italica]|uniref:acidic repeat-containing protein-like n=1 Tax=Setaria italica TaxID=4555 RepID=UPI0003511CFB|nr:acidic repeat-containing protein-like [Setaria italica]
MSTPLDSPIDPSGLWPPKLPQVVSYDKEDSIAVSSNGEHGSMADEFYGVKSDEDISEGVDNDTDDANDNSDDGKDDDSDDSDDGEDNYNDVSDDGEDGNSDDNEPPSKIHHVDNSSEDGGGPGDDDTA